jgi:hypothetical protein
MASNGLQDMGPIDYLVVEFPGSKMTGEGLPLLVDLVDRGIIRILYENRWAAPFASALRRGGAQVVASGRIPVPDVLATLDATESGG